MIFPIFAFLLFAVIDGGLVMGRYNNANQAAGVGARLAATNTPVSTVRSAIQDQMHGEMSGLTCDDSEDDVCIDFRTGPNGEAAGDVGSIVVVYVRYEYDLITPIVGNATGGDWDIDACSVQRVERPISGSNLSFDQNVTEC